MLISNSSRTASVFGVIVACYKVHVADSVSVMVDLYFHALRYIGRQPGLDIHTEVSTVVFPWLIRLRGARVRNTSCRYSGVTWRSG